MVSTEHLKSTKPASWSFVTVTATLLVSTALDMDTASIIRAKWLKCGLRRKCAT